MKHSAAIVEAAREHADAEARSAEASAVEHAAHIKEVEAQATAASSRQHADELEIALKRAQLLAASAAARAEQYAGAAVGNATVLADKLREAHEWRLEMEKRAKAAEMVRAKAEADAGMRTRIAAAAAKALADVRRYYVCAHNRIYLASSYLSTCVLYTHTRRLPQKRWLMRRRRRCKYLKITRRGILIWRSLSARLSRCDSTLRLSSAISKSPCD